MRFLEWPSSFHALNRTPESHGSLGLDEASLRDHIAWDVGAAGLSEALAARLDMVAILSGYSRLFIDCNSTPDHPELVGAESDGRLVSGNQELTAQDIDVRRKRAYEPYHAAIEHWLDQWLASGLIPVVLSVHSMTRQLEGQPVRPWQACILWNQDGRLAQPLLTALRVQAAWCRRGFQMRSFAWRMCPVRTNLSGRDHGPLKAPD